MALINVPLSGQTLRQTRDSIRNNFSTINTGFSVDHGEFNTANQGFHNKVTFPLQAATPIFGGKNGLWSEVFATTGIGEIWLNHLNGKKYPLSSSILSTAPATTSTTGWTYLPSGIVMKWFFASTNASGTATVNVNTTGPNLNAIFTAQATEQAGGATDTNSYIRITGIAAPNVTLFGCTRTTGTAKIVPFNLFVIGRE